MCKAEMKRNDDGTYTVTVDGKTSTFDDCITAAAWADEQRFEEEKE